MSGCVTWSCAGTPLDGTLLCGACTPATRTPRVDHLDHTDVPRVVRVPELEHAADRHSLPYLFDEDDDAPTYDPADIAARSVCVLTTETATPADMPAEQVASADEEPTAMLHEPTETTAAADVALPAVATTETDPEATARAAAAVLVWCAKCHEHTVPPVTPRTPQGTETWCQHCRRLESMARNRAAGKPAKARTATPTSDASAPDDAPAGTAVGPELAAAMERVAAFQAWLTTYCAPYAEAAERLDAIRAQVSR